MKIYFSCREISNEFFEINSYPWTKLRLFKWLQEILSSGHELMYESASQVLTKKMECENLYAQNFAFMISLLFLIPFVQEYEYIKVPRKTLPSNLLIDKRIKWNPPEWTDIEINLWRKFLLEVLVRKNAANESKEVNCSYRNQKNIFKKWVWIKFSMKK